MKKKTWIIKSGEGRQAEYVAGLNDGTGRLIWGLRDEALRFHDRAELFGLVGQARLESPKSGARAVALIRIGEEWKAMREALAANERAVAAIEATVHRFAKLLGAQLAEISAQAAGEVLQSSEVKDG